MWEDCNFCVTCTRGTYDMITIGWSPTLTMVDSREAIFAMAAFSNACSALEDETNCV